MERLSAQSASLEREIAAATERTALARQSRDEASRAVLRLEPAPGVNAVGIPVAMAAGMLSGLLLSWWWLSLPWCVASPRLAAAVTLGGSALVLLRGAWRAGRVAGARGP